MNNKFDFAERKILLGLIWSTEFAKKIRDYFQTSLLESQESRLVASWCWNYFNQYSKVPGKELLLRFEQEKEKLGKLEESVQLLIESLLEEEFDIEVDFLVEFAKEYFAKRRLEKHIERVEKFLGKSEVEKAEEEVLQYRKFEVKERSDIDLFVPGKKVMEKVREAFTKEREVLVKYSGALGKFWNASFTREAFVALMGAEKRGKTYMLMDIAMKAMQGNRNVVFFQAGDMSEHQMIRRIGIYLAHKSDRRRYCGELYIPVLDCVYNQLNDCDENVRECHFGVLEDEKDINNYEKLVEAYESNPDYQPCSNCDKLKGCVWFKKREPVEPLTWREAYKKFKDFSKKHKSRFKLCTYPNSTLTVREIERLLREWEREDGFRPDVIVIDYVDIMRPERRYDQFRHQQNELWMRLRALSQEWKCLVVTATQCASSGYDKELLRLSDFSEDKRKYAHVTAMYGLNQTVEEKKLGLMRINALVLRDEECNPNETVKVLQRLQIGRPVLESYK